jgi:hypothetical protein
VNSLSSASPQHGSEPCPPRDDPGVAIHCRPGARAQALIVTSRIVCRSRSRNRNGRLLLLLELAHEGELLCRGLEATMAKLGRRVDELERHWLERTTVRLGKDRLAECEHPLADTDGRPLDHDKVLLDLAVVGETTHRRDRLLSRVSLGRCVVVGRLALDLVDAGGNAVDLF